MALVDCSECSHKVSELAEACPSCGAPIAGMKHTLAAGTQVQTVEETSKRFKVHILLSLTMAAVGIFWIISVADSADERESLFPGLLAIAGLFWFLVTRFRIWWHHK